MKVDRIWYDAVNSISSEFGWEFFQSSTPLLVLGV